MSKIIGVTVGTPISPTKIENDLKPEIKAYIDSELGDVEAALDELHAYAEALKVGVDSPLPIEVSNEEEMTALLATAEVGSIYKYTGENTDTYTNGELYIVEEAE